MFNYTMSDVERMPPGGDQFPLELVDELDMLFLACTVQDRVRTMTQNLDSFGMQAVEGHGLAALANRKNLEYTVNLARQTADAPEATVSRSPEDAALRGLRLLYHVVHSLTPFAPEILSGYRRIGLYPDWGERYGGEIANYCRLPEKVILLAIDPEYFDVVRGSYDKTVHAASRRGLLS
jgi:hypothetical protein